MNRSRSIIRQSIRREHCYYNAYIANRSSGDINIPCHYHVIDRTIRCYDKKHNIIPDTFLNNNRKGYQTTARRCLSSSSTSDSTIKYDNNNNNCYKYATLKVLGNDRKGIIAAITNILDQYQCNIVQSEHYTDETYNIFFQRIVFDHPYRNTKNKKNNNEDSNNVDNNVNNNNNEFHHFQNEITLHINDVKNQLQLQIIDIDWYDKIKRIAIYVSQYDHCLWELLLHYNKSNNHILKQNHNNVIISLIISNHYTCQKVADTFTIPYYVFSKNEYNKLEQEQKEIQLLKENHIDIIVLARYMQILSSSFLKHYETNQIINIHHSFLPAFIGSRAYHNAYERGVKLIGATGHYVTSNVDTGPIIQQDVIHVTHRDTISNFIYKGRLLERNVLLNSIQAHLDNRTLIYNNKCVVFGD